MARVHYSRFVGRAGKTRLPVKTVGGPDDPTHGDGPRLVLVCRRGDYIEKGQQYLWFAPGFRARKTIGCMQHHPRPSEMDSSLYSEVLGAQESAGDTLGGFTWNGSDSADDVKEQVNDILQEVRDAIESVASQYEDAAESMGGDSGAGAQFAEWAQTLQDSEIMDWEAGDYDDPDETEAWCEKHTDDMVGDEPDQVSASDIDQAREDCEDCKPDLSDWTADLVAEAQEKVDAVSKE